MRNPGEERMQAHPSAMCTKMLLIPDGKSAEEQVWGTKIESEICVSSKWKCVVIVSGAECGGLNRGNPAGSQGKMKLPEGQSIGRKGESAWIEGEELRDQDGDRRAAKRGVSWNPVREEALKGRDTDCVMLLRGQVRHRGEEDHQKITEI